MTDISIRPTSDAPSAERSRSVWPLWSDGFGRLATRSIQIILIATVAIGIAFVILRLTPVTIPIVLALIVASALAPMTSWLRRHNIRPLLATIITLLAVVIVVLLLAWLITWAVIDEWDELSAQARNGLETVMAWLNTLPFDLPNQEQIDEWLSSLANFFLTSEFGSGALAGVGSVVSFFTGLGLMVVVLFFFLKDGPQIREFFLRPLHGENYVRAHRATNKVKDALGAYVRGTATVALVDAVGIGLGLVILGVPLAIPLAVLVFILAFIPIVGAIVAGIIAALVALVAKGWVVALIVVAIVILVNQLEGDFLQPLLMGRSVKLHPLVILVALTIGTVTGGIVGAILAVPIVAAVWAAIRVWDGPDLPARWARAKPALETEDAVADSEDPVSDADAAEVADVSSNGV